MFFLVFARRSWTGKCLEGFNQELLFSQLFFPSVNITTRTRNDFRTIAIVIHLIKNFLRPSQCSYTNVYLPSIFELRPYEREHNGISGLSRGRKYNGGKERR